MKTLYSISDDETPDIEFVANTVGDFEAENYLGRGFWYTTKRAAIRAYVRELVTQITDAEVDLKYRKELLKKGRAFAKRNNISVAQG